MPSGGPRARGLAPWRTVHHRTPPSRARETYAPQAVRRAPGKGAADGGFRHRRQARVGVPARDNSLSAVPNPYSTVHPYACAREILCGERFEQSPRERRSRSHFRDDTGMPPRQTPAGILKAACTHQRQKTYHAKQGTMGCRPCGILRREMTLRATALCRSPPMPLRTTISNARGGPTGRVWDAGAQGGTLTLRVMAGDISK